MKKILIPFLKHQSSKVLFSTTTLKTQEKSYKYVIAGGGTGGITMAARLLSLGQNNIAVIEPSDEHYYQPYWTLVGGMLKNLEKSVRPMKDVMPNTVAWIKDEVVGFDPASNFVHIQNGDKIKYDFLIVAMGITLAFDKIKGLKEAFNTKGVCSNYSIHTVTKTVKAIQGFTEGNAIFTQPINPIKCGGAPQKIMYLTESILRKIKRREKANIIFNTALPVMFSAPKYSDILQNVAKDKGITVNFQHSLVEVKSDSKEAVFEKLNTSDTSKTVVFKYEMLHVVPPMLPPPAIEKSPLADAAGYVDVCKYTMQHKNFKNVFALGDCSNLPTSKTAAAVAAQCGVLTTNIIAASKGLQDQLPEMYYGYTSCPLLTGDKKAILAEFDYDLKPMETMPFDQGKQRYSSYWLKVELIPYIYWNMMLKGKWAGPSLVRKLFHLGKK